MSKFNVFFEKLGSDAKLLEQYKQDPQAVMQAHGLSEEEIQVVLSGDKNKIESIAGAKPMGSYTVVFTSNR
ncbi:hypothetical protein AB4298_18265 [Shewanella sp. 10N.261.52.F9]|uniref:hypothetical protein n=1 Tax=Shewanella TaxID=22 RepID=UPI00200BBD68|nr:hypothetical protein [Shewanella marinintestina]MCL1145344.1 hypothetical protein [Shewanella marinintestina]